MVSRISLLCAASTHTVSSVVAKARQETSASRPPLPTDRRNECPSPGLLGSHRSDFAGVYRQPPHPPAKLRLAFGESVAEGVSHPAMDGEGYPYPALALARTSPPRLVAPLTVRRCLGQNGPQLQTKCDAKTASGPPAGDLRQGFSTKGSASHFNQKIRHDGRTRTVLEICTSILCRPAFRATAWRTDWLHKNARGRFKICSAPEETKQLLLPAREHAAQAAERSTACPNRRPAPPEPDSAPHQMSWGGDASCPWGSIHGPWGVPHARSLSAGTERRDSRLFTTGQHEGQLTTLPATSTSRRKGRSVSIEGSLWGLADIGSSL